MRGDVAQLDWQGVPVWHYSSIDSTNSEALRRHAELPDRAVIWATEQTAGRGRLGRQWQARAGGSLCLSVFCRQPMTLAAAAGLGPALGLAAARCLTDVGVKSVAVKWPNDLQVNGAKLAGILVEVAEAGDAGLSLVAGVGVNLDLGDELAIDQAWTDCKRLGLEVTAESLARRLSTAFLAALDRIVRDGLAAVLDEWPAFDALAGQTVRIEGASRGGGRVLGIAEDGRLRLQDEQGEWRCHSGEVRVRPVPCC